VVTVIAAVVLLLDKRARWRFNDKFPPIDDDAFVRRCGPGVSRDTALRVRRIISEQLGIEYERIYPEQRFVDDLQCD
jgi:hypothetical protein